MTGETLRGGSMVFGDAGDGGVGKLLWNYFWLVSIAVIWWLRRLNATRLDLILYLATRAIDWRQQLFLW